MAPQATTATSTHLLTPHRVDQLVREHFDPLDYPAYPGDLVAEYEALSAELDQQIPTRAAALTAAGHDPTDGSEPAVAAHHAWISAHDQRLQELDRQISDRLRRRRSVLDELYRTLGPVAAERHRAPEARYLSAQQWLWHVHEAAAAIGRSDKRANVLAVAEALAEHARSDGVFLAGVRDVQLGRGIAHSTWTRAYAWLVEHDLAVTLSAQRLLTQLERALAIGSETHAHVHRWRAVIQLQHTRRRILRPTKWVPPVRSTVNKESSSLRDTSTDLRPVDDGAPRRQDAAPPRHITKKSRRWVRFDPLTKVFYTRLQRLAERQTRPQATTHPDRSFLGSQMTPQRDRVLGCLLHASPRRLLPHLKRFAIAEAEPAALVSAIEDAEYRSGRDPNRRTWDPTRRLIAALRELDITDIPQS